MRRFPFSNFQPFVIRYAEIEFPTVEHFYQALKTADHAKQREIAGLDTPGMAKKVGQQLERRPNWDRLKFQIMRIALQKKFAPGSGYHDLLMATGDAQITEWNTWHDRVWGKCSCHSCCGTGENRLGIMLMKIREGYKTKPT